MHLSSIVHYKELYKLVPCVLTRIFLSSVKEDESPNQGKYLQLSKQLLSLQHGGFQLLIVRLGNLNSLHCPILCFICGC